MPIGPFDDWDHCVSTMEGRVDDPEAYCASLKSAVQTGQLERGDVRVGSFVEWDWQDGTAQGQVESIHTEGPVNVPGADVTLDADEENPTALIESWVEIGESGTYRPTGTMVGRRFASLRRIDPLPEGEQSLQAEPGGGVLPDAYRPADAEDVPDGRSCANCFYYQDGHCSLWDAAVDPEFYCDAWAADDATMTKKDDKMAGHKDDEASLYDDDDDMSAKEMVTVETFDPTDELLVTTEGRLRAATIVPIPAFVEARLTMTDDERWEGVLAPEGVPTGDGRMFAPGSVQWADLPVPLMWVKEMDQGHDGAQVVGTIETVAREGNLIVGTGRFDMGSEAGREAARQVQEGINGGVSVDLDSVALEVRVAADLLDDLEVEVVASGQPWRLTASVDASGRTPTEGMAEEAQRALDWRAEGHAGGEDNTVERARSIAAREPLGADTIRRMHAFFARNARYPDLEGFSPGDDGYPSAARVAWGLWGGDAGRTWAGSLVDRLEEGSLTASARPATWFDDPQLSGPTPVTVTDDGRIFGHLALWGTCHTGFGRECVTPPSSPSRYAFFRTGVVTLDDGTDMPVGRITLDTVHAGRRLAATDTVSHYEHTGLSVAHVTAGEDAHGIWVAGAVAPGVTDDQLERLKTSPLSGDWRSVGGQLELVAALAVNVPGFPVPRAMVASGRITSLQASGPAPDVGLADDEVAVLKRAAAREFARERRELADRARNRVTAVKARAKVGR